MSPARAPPRKRPRASPLKRTASPAREAPPPRHFLWSAKHRPHTLDDIVGQEAAVALLKRVAAGGDLPHLALYGPSGTGKRSAALALAWSLFGDGWEGSASFLDLSAGGRGPLRDLLTPIARMAGMRPVGQRFRLMVLDGCDAVAPVAQQGLRRIVERLSGGSRFLLLTSRLGRWVPALRSRFLPVPFRPLSDSALGALVDRVARAEGVRFSGSGRGVLLFHARGSGERALHLLQAAHLASGGRPLEAGDVLRATSGWETDFGPLARSSYGDARAFVDRFLVRGLAAEEVVERFAAHLAASPIVEEEKAAWAAALAEADGRLREGLRGRTQLQGLWEPPVRGRPPEPASGTGGAPPRSRKGR